jgi:HAD superfamily hydrolase (TIGR01490 family)
MTNIGENQRTVAVFDLDRTLSRKDTYLPFLFLALKARPHRVFNALLLPFAVLSFHLGVRDNAWLKSVFLKAIAGGATRSQVDVWSEKLVARLQRKGLRTRALEQLDYHRAAGHRTILVTASFDFYVRRLAEQLKFDHAICSDAAWTDTGLLTGAFVSENCYGNFKLKQLKNYLPGKRKHWQIIAFSDHHSDLPLLEWADYGVAINPTRQLRAIALQKNFEIRNWS